MAEMTTKDLDCCMHVLVKQQGLRGLAPVLKGVLLHIKGCQTASHAAGKLFMEESVGAENIIVVLF